MKKNPSELNCVVIIGTPGRIEAAILKQKRFSAKKLEFLILDEADRLLDLGFEMQVREPFKGSGCVKLGLWCHEINIFDCGLIFPRTGQLHSSLSAKATSNGSIFSHSDCSSQGFSPSWTSEPCSSHCARCSSVREWFRKHSTVVIKGRARLRPPPYSPFPLPLQS